MDQKEHQTDAHRRPKKLIFAPGDIAPTSEQPTPEPQPQAVPAANQIAEALRTSSSTPISTPNSTTETEVLSHAARAHQFGTNPPLTISQIHGTNPLHQFNTWFRDPRLLASSAPETCTLSTASLPSGRVSARIVYLKELDERGWVIYSNWGSREGKGGQVFGLDGSDTLGAMPEPTSITSEARTGNRWGALTFNWGSVERQVRVEGLLEPLSREESEMYWRTRERGSRIGGWASWQSRVLWSAEPGQMEENQRRKSVAKLQGAFDGNSIVPADIDQTDDEDGRALLELKVKEMEERFKDVEDIPLPPFWGGVRLVPESVEFWQGRRSRLHDRFRYVRVEGEEEVCNLITQPSEYHGIYSSISTAAMSTSTQSTSSTSPWIILAITSGAFAALNGVFAKLTTDDHTTAFAQSLAHLFGLESSPVIEMLTRGACLGLNVICNIIMWALFTRALTAGPSTVKVSITNTASNFLATALFGMVVFQEAVGGLWWLGAAMMGAGCILVGMREGA
ncbi:FMN-binding split barrel-related protein [Penicillium fimorum]|uniref:pyridoxal 5'-phosphate synthase n=1 Tax=Penicillium fimorum TaxID=1882269 RepID=A0A9W9XNW9_9EURO|nr:FMN-binding split barrel-related protein [Penicillium fimorum]